MEMTDAQRLIVVMLCDLYKKAGIRDSLDPEFIRDAVINGHSWAIKTRYGGFLGIDNDNVNLKDEVYDILHMWSLIEHSYGIHGREGLQKIKDAIGREPPRFNGFDGNNEIEHLSAADFIVNRLDGFASLKHKVVNSHMPVLASYRRMLAKFRLSEYDDSLRAIPIDHLISVLDHSI